MGRILLFYKYVNIEDPVAIQTWQLRLCKRLGLTGRVIVATEGINGTLGGTMEATQSYKEAMEEHPLFGGIDFKQAPGDASFFPRTRIMIRKEIVALGIDPELLTVKDGGKHLTPEETHALLNNPPADLVILDTRNNYESRIGTFRNSIIPDIDTFREFPEFIDATLDQYKDKTVLMHCTGGVRCERATAYLKVKGVAKEIYQIQGGIQRYIEKYPDGHFRGSNYVFDGRVSERINDDILSECDLCAIPCDEYNNCMNALCNKQYLACADCVIAFKECCSKACYELLEQGLVKRRPAQKKIPALGLSYCPVSKNNSENFNQ